MYRTFHTFEILQAASAVDFLPVAANCNAITFRPLVLPPKLQLAPTDGTAGRADDNGLVNLLESAPQVQGIPLMPAIFPVIDQQPTENRLTSNLAAQSGADSLTFEAGHPDALDGTVYQVRLTRQVGLLVIRRFITRA